MDRLLFEPPVGTVSTAFWRRLAQLKLDEWRLQTDPIPLVGHYEPGRRDADGEPIPLRLFLDEESFDLSSKRPGQRVIGTLHLFNTLPAFKALSKQQVLQEQAEALVNGSASQFLLFVHADLKKHRYFYHFCYPSLLSDCIEGQEIAGKTEGLDTMGPPAWEGDTLTVVDGSAQGGLVVGWWVRNLLLLSGRTEAKLRLLGEGGSSRVLQVRFRPTNGQATGWERNERGQIAPRQLDLAALLDPMALIAEAANLNLKLIKWRLMPELDLNRLAQARCLLLGAGTLGCNVARGLLGWGVKHVTLVDYGQVSLSNPLRQSLFTQADVGGGKAERAAIRLQEIDPTATAISGISLHIPMPGHRLDDRGEWRQQVEQLQSLIAEHEVIFLLTDSRESRWLPTMLAACASPLPKTVMTVALGFDSSVVMRHGCPGNGLACYFCADQLGPSDVMLNVSFV